MTNYEYLLKVSFTYLNNILIVSQQKYIDFRVSQLWFIVYKADSFVIETSLSFNNYIVYLKSLDYLCFEASSSFSAFIIVTNTSAIPSSNMQTISVVYFWKLGYQMLSSKASAGRTTAPDVKLFTIKLRVFKATNMNIKHIILITNSKR